MLKKTYALGYILHLSFAHHAQIDFSSVQYIRAPSADGFPFHLFFLLFIVMFVFPADATFSVGAVGVFWIRTFISLADAFIQSVVNVILSEHRANMIL